MFDFKKLRMLKKYFSSLFLFSIFACSDTIIIENQPDTTTDAVAIPGYFKKRVLVEDYTGTWCGNCARVAFAIKKLEEDTNINAVFVAIHSGNDPFNYADIKPLKDLISPQNDLALPQSRLNRTLVWSAPEPKNLAQVKNQTGNNCGLGLKISSSRTNQNIALDVSIKFAAKFENIRLVVCVLENKLIFDQEDYTTYFGLKFPNHTLFDFEHNHVLRSSLTPILGDLISENTTNGQTILKHFETTVSTKIKDANNLSFVAFVVDQNNTVINVRAANINEVQVFEEN